MRILFRASLSFFLSSFAFAGEPVYVPRTRVTMEPPADYKLADRFSGFVSEKLNTSILVAEIPATLDLSTRKFDDKGFKEQGMKMLSKEKKTFGKTPGVLIHASQVSDGKSFHKWIAAMGDIETSLITATYPSDAPPNVGMDLKIAIASATIQPEALNAALNFKLAATDGYEVNQILANGLIITPKGAVKKTGEASSLLIASASLTDEVKIEKRKEFALERLKKTATLTKIKPKAPAEIALDELNGYEIVGDAVHEKSGKPVSVYQAMVFDEDGYFLLVAIDATAEHEHLANFKKMVNSFKRR